MAVAGIAALACAGAGRANAADEDLTPPPANFALPGVALKIVPTQITIGMREEVTFTVTLTRRIEKGALELTLPKAWMERSPEGNRLTSAPGGGPRGANDRVRVGRTGRVVRLSFSDGRRNDTGSYTVSDRGLKPGTYRLRFTHSVDGDLVAAGTVSVVVIGLRIETPTP